MSGEDVRFAAHDTFVVCEDEDERQPEVLNQRFKFDAIHKSSASVLFRLSFSITDSSSTKTIIYLQIKPDCIASFRATICDTSDTSKGSPACLERIRQRLGNINLVLRLQLQLHKGTHAQLVVPHGFTLDKIPDDPARCAFSSATSLAAASSFSLYLPHNVRPMKEFQKLARAVEQFPALTAAQRKSYERIVDLSRLYNGNGGTVFTLEDQNGSSLPDRDRGRSTTPAMSESCATTNPVDTPSLYQDSPPQYHECLNEAQRPRDSLGAIFMSAKDSGGDCAPPVYRDTERHHDVMKASERSLHCGSEDIDLNPTSKRKYSIGTGCTTTGALTRNDVHPEKRWRFPPAYPDCSHMSLIYLFEQQSQQIRQLEESVKELTKKNEKLEGRYVEMEENCCNLENRQFEIEETMETVHVQVGELDDEYGRLGRQVSDICDEVDDVKANTGDTVKEHMEAWLEEDMTEPLKGYINNQVTDQVTDQMAQVKMKIRKALED